MNQKSRQEREKNKGIGPVVLKGSFCGGDDKWYIETTRILIQRLSLTMTTTRMIVDDCVDSLTVFSGFINRVATEE